MSVKRDIDCLYSVVSEVASPPDRLAIAHPCETLTVGASRTVVGRDNASCRPFPLVTPFGLRRVSPPTLGHTGPHHLMHLASEDTYTHSRRGRRGGVSVSTCFGDHPMHRNVQNVLRMTLFKSLPRLVSTFGWERRRQPVHIDDKMTPPVHNRFFHSFKRHEGIDGFVGGRSIPSIRLSSQHCHHFPTQPSDQGPTEALSKFAIWELGQTVQDRSHQT